MSLVDGWETVCGTYIGTGEEEFLIIGGFHTDKDIEDEKVRSLLVFWVAGWPRLLLLGQRQGHNDRSEVAMCMLGSR